MNAVRHKFESNNLIQTVSCGCNFMTTETGPTTYSRQGFIYHPKQYIFEWSIQCVVCNDNDIIGIASECDEEVEAGNKYMFQSKGSTCYWWKFMQLCHGSDQYNWKVVREDGNDQWYDGDTITIRLNRNDGTIIFSRNGQQVFESVEIDDKSKEITWYPFITLGSIDSEYNLVV